MKKLIWIIFLLPLAVVLISLSVANRHDVNLVLDPFAPQDPALAIHLPFFAYIFLAILFGFVLGGIVSWMNQGKWRRSARHQAKEVKQLRKRAEKLGQQVEAKDITINELVNR